MLVVSVVGAMAVAGGLYDAYDALQFRNPADNNVVTAGHDSRWGTTPSHCRAWPFDCDCPQHCPPEGFADTVDELHMGVEFACSSRLTAQHTPSSS